MDYHFHLIYSSSTGYAFKVNFLLRHSRKLGIKFMKSDQIKEYATVLKRIQLMTIVIVLGLFGGAHALPVKWAGNGHYYQKVDVPEGITWYDAWTAAQASDHLGVGGHLVTITSSAENIFLTVNKELGNGANGEDLINMHWMGAYQARGFSEPYGGWFWVSPEEFYYNNWMGGEPNNLGDENTVHFAGGNINGKEWKDAEGAVLLSGYIVEFEVPCGEGEDLDEDRYCSADGIDCNDGDTSVNPEVAEVCGDGIDNNCNGNIDEELDYDGDGYTTCSGDCRDNNSSVNPSAVEVCDSLDNDCDGNIDEGFDNDDDGYPWCSDCDDNNADVHPGIDEICDGIDNNCDGSVDPDFTDADQDGSPYCTDCNDNDPAVYPGAAETCNDTDDDCDSSVDEGFPTSSWYSDYDGDTYGNPSIWQDRCSQPAEGWVADNTDCNDSDANIYPGGPEVRIESPLAYYQISQLQTAYNDAGNGATVKSKVETFTGDFTIDQDKTVTFDGGYDCGYSTAPGKTTVAGTMTIISGKVIIGNFQVQ